MTRLTTDLNIRQFIENRLPKLRKGQTTERVYRNVILRSLDEKRKIYYLFKGKYLNNKDVR
jgi:hypothetical protein